MVTYINTALQSIAFSFNYDIVISALETLIKQISFPSFSDGEGSFDPEEAAIVYHMICTSPTAARYIILSYM